MSTCPRGVKVQLLGHGGVAVYAVYDGDPFWISWAPLPKRRKHPVQVQVVKRDWLWTCFVNLLALGVAWLVPARYGSGWAVVAAIGTLCLMAYLEGVYEALRKDRDQ